MQRNNREAIRQKSNSYTFVVDADFLLRDTLFIGATSTDDYTTKKTNFFEQFRLFSQLFLVFRKELYVDNDLCAFHRPNYTLFSLKMAWKRK